MLAYIPYMDPMGNGPFFVAMLDSRVNMFR